MKNKGKIVKYIISLLFIMTMFIGCNSEGNLSEEVETVDSIPQPSLSNTELQPPKSPSLK